MVQAETALQNRIRLMLSAHCKDVVHFRNHTGALKDNRGRMVRFGLGAGSPDIVGWKAIEITPDMVGQRVAVFVGIEIKIPGEQPRPDQNFWLSRLNAAGGIAGVAHSEYEAIDLLSGG